MHASCTKRWHPAQGVGFSEAVAALEAEVKTLRAGKEQLAEDNKVCYALIRAKDKQLDQAQARVEEARLIAMENKVRHAQAPPAMHSHKLSLGIVIVQCIIVYSCA